jgi:hypothetical protein
MPPLPHRPPPRYDASFLPADAYQTLVKSKGHFKPILGKTKSFLPLINADKTLIRKLTIDFHGYY